MREQYALTHRAAELLRASEVADQIGKVKVGLLRSAAWWFRIAILLLACLAGVLLAYSITTSHPANVADDSGTTVRTFVKTSIRTVTTPAVTVIVSKPAATSP